MRTTRKDVAGGKSTDKHKAADVKRLIAILRLLLSADLECAKFHAQNSGNSSPPNKGVIGVQGKRTAQLGTYHRLFSSSDKSCSGQTFTQSRRVM
jgi:hypothetical protein